jgi:acyl-CoA thioester hydrolase
MLQEARVIFEHDFAMPKLGDGLRPVMGAMAIEFTAEITYPGTVEVATGVLRVGSTSFTVAQRIRHNGRSAVYAQITMVASGPNGATPIPADYRAALEEKAMIG